MDLETHGMPKTAYYTVDEAIDSVGFGRFQVAMLFYAGMAWLGDAMEVMLLSYVGPATECAWKLGPTEQSLLTSAVFLGMAIGACTWGSLSDARGRRVAFLASVSMTVTFGFASAAAPNFWVLLLLRTFVGVGLSGAPVCYALLMEFVPASTRGVWLVAIQAFWTLGTLSEAALAWAVVNSYGWRLLLTASACPLVTLLVLSPLLPESPRYLLVKGRTREAQAVLERMFAVNRMAAPAGSLRPLHRAQERSSDDDVDDEAADGPLVTGHQQHNARSLVADLLVAAGQLGTPQLRSLTLQLLFIWVVSAFSYYGLVQLAAQLSMEGGHKGSGCVDGALHVEESDLLSIMMTSAAEVPAIALCAMAVQKCGRRKPIAACFALTALALLPLAFGADGPVAQASLFGSRLFIMAAFTLLYVITPELYPTAVRTVGLGINNAASRMGGLLSPFAAINMVHRGWASGAALLFALLCLAAAAAMLAVRRETSGKVLADTVEDLSAALHEGGSDGSSVHGSGLHGGAGAGAGGSWGEPGVAGRDGEARHCTEWTPLLIEVPAGDTASGRSSRNGSGGSRSTAASPALVRHRSAADIAAASTV